jgi:para-nitrobenzyl esterase
MGEVVRIEQGRLRGVATADGIVHAYRGIPYAEPPVGPLRWRPPRPPASWDGVRRADSYGPAAPQPPVPARSLYHPGPEPRSEDCLYLNVWTAAGPGDRRPVLVWFHMGAYLFGSGSAGAGPRSLYDGEQLARAGAVVVTLNHRLGRLGFLAHPELTAESEHGASGNYGLMDHVAALEWVRRNIAAFGGDPDRVTIFGLSAGSYSVSHLMASPLARGLFHRAIGQSGAAFGPAGDTCGVNDLIQDLPAGERTGVRLAEALGARSLEELRALSPERLMAVPLPSDEPARMTMNLGPERFGRGAFESGYPVVDGHLLPTEVHEVFRAGRQHDVPLITGWVANEAAGVGGVATLEDHVADAREEYGDAAGRFLELYPASTDAEAFRASAASNGDRIFVAQNWAWARAHGRTGSAPTFLYHWSRVPPIPPSAGYVERDPGAFHSAEVPYVFRHVGVEGHARDWDWTAADVRLSDAISSYWLAFAETGDPNRAGLPDWPAFDEAAPVAMHFGDDVAAGPVPDREKLAFWDDHYARARATAAR